MSQRIRENIRLHPLQVAHEDLARDFQITSTLALAAGILNVLWDVGSFFSFVMDYIFQYFYWDYSSSILTYYWIL